MIKTSENIEKIAAALLVAQAKMHGAVKDSKNPAFRSNYASLESVMESAKPALQEAGISFTQAPGSLVEGAVEIETMLIHAESGQWLSSTLQVPLGKKDPQGVGSAITYGLRYSLMAMLGLPPVDDDGESAMGRVNGKGPPTKAEAREIDKEMRAEIDACSTEEELVILWRSPAFKAELARHPENWREMIEDYFKARKEEIQKGSRDG